MSEQPDQPEDPEPREDAPARRWSTVLTFLLILAIAVSAYSFALLDGLGANDGRQPAVTVSSTAPSPSPSPSPATTPAEGTP